jgi:CPA2 family monovalent cation:H+ antiporter-2
MKSLASLGVQHVIHPELEGGLQIVRRTLLQLGFPLGKVHEYADAVRGDYYDSSVNTEQERQLLHDLLSASDNIGITWLRLGTKNPLVGRSLAEANLRATAGASVVAIMREGELITNPDSRTVLRAKDLVGLIGNEEQLSAAQTVLATSADGGKQASRHSK